MLHILNCVIAKEVQPLVISDAKGKSNFTYVAIKIPSLSHVCLDISDDYLRKGRSKIEIQFL